MQYYQGKPVLTWWEGKVTAGHGVGEYVIFDRSYREIARISAGNDHRRDLHEFLITTEFASHRADTPLTTWEVLAGPRQSRLESVGSVPRDGFETAMLVKTSHSYVAVPANDRLGQPLGTSAPVKTKVHKSKFYRRGWDAWSREQ
jgi:hypothetical protein